MGRKNPQFLTKLRIFGPSEKIRTSGLLNPMVPVSGKTRKLVHEYVKRIENQSLLVHFLFSTLCFFLIPVKIPVRKNAPKITFDSAKT